MNRLEQLIRLRGRSLLQLASVVDLRVVYADIAGVFEAQYQSVMLQQNAKIID